MEKEIEQELNEIIKETNKVQGQIMIKNEQYSVFYPFIRDLKPDSLLVEIGTFYGRSTRFFSLVNPSIKILTIDKMDVSKDVSLVLVKIDKEVLKNGNIFQVIGDSSVIVSGFNWKIDFLFIDGDHSYDGVQKDIKNWLSFLKSQSYVIFHDYSVRFPEVVRAINDWDGNGFEKIGSDAEMFVAKKL